MQMQSLCRLLATSKFSQLQITYDNVNLLRLGSCLVHSSESYQVVDRKLSPLSTPPLLQRDEGESSKAVATDASSWKIIAPIFAAAEEQPGCVSHISEALGRMRNELRRIRNELMLQSPFGYTRKTRLLSNQNLKMPVAVSHKLLTRLCTDYTRGSGWGLCFCKSTWKTGTWCKFQYKKGKEPSIKILKLSNRLMALSYFMSVITTWPLAPLYCRCTATTLHPPHMASTINIRDAWLTLFPNWFLGKRSNDSNSAVVKHYKGPKLPTIM